MKLKILIAVVALALSSVAQTGPQPNAQAPASKTCACCNHEGGTKAGCADCCKDGKCPMMSGSHAGMKCPMMAKNGKMADGKTCCSSNKCPMHAKGGNGGCCCGNMDEPKQPGA